MSKILHSENGYRVLIQDLHNYNVQQSRVCVAFPLVRDKYTFTHKYPQGTSWLVRVTTEFNNYQSVKFKIEESEVYKLNLFFFFLTILLLYSVFL